MPQEGRCATFGVVQIFSEPQRTPRALRKKHEQQPGSLDNRNFALFFSSRLIGFLCALCVSVVNIPSAQGGDLPVEESQHGGEILLGDML